METNPTTANESGMKQYELSKNAHPTLGGEDWGWIVIKGTRIRVATYACNAERDLCKELLSLLASQSSQLDELRKELKEARELIQDIDLIIDNREDETSLDTIKYIQDKVYSHLKTIKPHDSGI